jgi:hypothetical protein
MKIRKARKQYFYIVAWRPAWINNLQMSWLESGANRASPGRYSVEQALARVSWQCRLRSRSQRIAQAAVSGLDGADFAFQLIAQGHQLIDFGNNAALFGEGRNGD